MFGLNLLRRPDLRIPVTFALRCYSDDGSDCASRKKLINKKLTNSYGQRDLLLDALASEHYHTKALETLACIIDHMSLNQIFPIYQFPNTTFSPLYTTFMPYRKICFDLPDALQQVEQFSKNKPLTGFRSFATTVIHDENFQENPGGVIQAWKAVKMLIDTYPEIEHDIHLFFFSCLKLNKPKF